MNPPAMPPAAVPAPGTTSVPTSAPNSAPTKAPYHIPAAAPIEEPIAPELNITMKSEPTEKPVSIVSQFEDISPVEMTIEETLKHRADDRRKKLKEFNYKFHNNPSKIEEMEKEPAYRRSGIDLTQNTQGNTSSRMSIGTDSNDDTQLRSNNSFLHDNVD